MRVAVLTVCAGAALVDGGLGHRFSLAGGDAFVVRYRGRVYAYYNRCPHRGLELDWQAGQFFDEQGQFLVCAVHGARYDPADGRCMGGPCRGRALQAVACREQGGLVFVEESTP